MSIVTDNRPSATARKESYFLANRNAWLLPAIFSITASWVMAPALITSAEVAYKWGWQGLLWFAVPNALVLVLFAPFAAKVRRLSPRGFTYSQFMRKTYGKKVQRVYLFQMTSVATCVYATQLIAGGALLAVLTPLSFWQVCAALVLGTLAYSHLGGFRTSVAADFFHIGATIITICLFIPMLIQTVGLGDIVAGMSSSHVDSLHLALTFGIPTAIGLLSGAFGDQAFWQRSFAFNARKLRKAFTFAGFLFILVPLSTGVLGFTAAGIGMDIDNTQLTNILTVQEVLPGWAVIPLTVMIVGALGSSMDNCLMDVSTMMGHDLTKKGDPIRRGRAVALVLAGVGFCIANIPGLTLLHLWLIYATVRAATVGPTVLTFMCKKRPAAAGVFWGVIIALAVSMPIFIYGSFFGDEMWKTAGSFLVIGLSSGIAYFWKRNEDVTLEEIHADTLDPSLK